MARKKKIYVTPKGSSNNKKYEWHPSTGNIKRSPPFGFSKKIGSADSLEDAISIIKNNEGGARKVNVKG